MPTPPAPLASPIVVVLREDVDGDVWARASCSSCPDYDPGWNDPADFAYRSDAVNHALAQSDDHLSDAHDDGGVGSCLLNLPDRARFLLAGARWEH